VKLCIFRKVSFLL